MRRRWSARSGFPNLTEMAEGRAAEARRGSRFPQVVEEEGWVADVREGDTSVPPAQVFAVTEGIGGARGWFYGTWLWRIRAVLDKMMGGAGMGSGRRDPDHLSQGDALDFWRVEEIEHGKRLLLKAMMKVPGEAYLMFETFPLATGGTCLRSSALFRPRGLWGRVYWWMLLPIHKFIFSGLNSAIRQRAEERVHPLPPSLTPTKSVA